MQLSASTLFVLSVCTLCIYMYQAEGAPAQPSRQRRSVYDPALTEAVLQELLEDIRRENAQMHKRRVDAGYGNRYGVASSVGSKLMALKQAADWNGPGRKRRETEGEIEDEA